MKRLLIIRKDAHGAAAIEFALVVPILVLVLWGIFQIALLFEANAGMQHALGEGARFASLYDSTTTDHIPTDTDIKARMNAKLFGPIDGTFDVQDPAAPPAGESGYKTLTITYTRTMNFLFFTGPAVTLTRTKKVYTTVDS